MYGIRKNLYKELLELFSSLNIKEVILFGSRARGDYKPNSDIDLAISYIDNDNNNIFRTMSKLEELKTLISFDAVDLNQIKDEKFKKNINKDGICIYKR